MELTGEEFDALVALARKGATDLDSQTRLEDYIKYLEGKNEVTRYSLLVQWQEVDTPLPLGVRFPTSWPPELRQLVERSDRPIARVDVDEILRKSANSPCNVLVTTDKRGLIGWTKPEVYFKE